MSNIQLDYSDITDIFKEKLKIDNIVKKWKTLFLRYCLFLLYENRTIRQLTTDHHTNSKLQYIF